MQGIRSGTGTQRSPQSRGSKWPDGHEILNVLGFRDRAEPPEEEPMSQPGGERGG